MRRIDHETVWKALKRHSDVGLDAAFTPDILDVDTIFVLQTHIRDPVPC